jgi:hypothetical protein
MRLIASFPAYTMVDDDPNDGSLPLRRVASRTRAGVKSSMRMMPDTHVLGRKVKPLDWQLS